VPRLTKLKLELQSFEGGLVLLTASEAKFCDGKQIIAQTGKNPDGTQCWNRTKKPQTKEHFALMVACFKLHALGQPDKLHLFRFKDRPKKKGQFSIREAINQKDKTTWDTKMFGNKEGINTVCSADGEYIQILRLSHDHIEISLDGKVLQLKEGSDDVPRLVELIRRLAGDNQPDDYAFRYAGKRLAELLTPSVTSALPPENEPSQYSAPPAATDPVVGTTSVAAQTKVPDTGNDAFPITQNEGTTSQLIDHDGERCLVAVHVDGVYQGTGFVVRSDVVVTCWHVACQNSGQLAIDFLADPALDSSALATVTVDQQHSNQEADIAFLKLSGSLPPGVTVAPIDWRARVLFGRQVRAKGGRRINSPSEPSPSTGSTHNNPTYSWEPAQGTVIGNGGQPGENGDPRLDHGNSISAGLSGAPVFDAGSLRVIGIARSIPRPDAQFHLQNIVYLRSLQSIRSLFPGLAPADDAGEFEFENRAQDALRELSQCMQDLLLSNRLACQEVATNFSGPKQCTFSEDFARSLVAEMLSKPPGFATGRLLKIYRKYRRDGLSPDLEVQSVIYRLYLAYAPAVLHVVNKDDVRLVFLQLQGSPSRTVLPISHTTILELFVAAVCGRPADFRKDHPPSADNPKSPVRYPRPQHLQSVEGSEKGFQNGNINLRFWLDKLNSLFDRIEEFATTTDLGQLAELNAYLETELEAGFPKAVVVEPKSKWLTDTQEEELLARFTALVILKLDETSQSGVSVATLLANPEFRNPLVEQS
jgi:hypothetical protein